MKEIKDPRRCLQIRRLNTVNMPVLYNLIQYNPNQNSKKLGCGCLQTDSKV